MRVDFDRATAETRLLFERATEEMLRLVPNSYREASIALGATKATTILKVVIPTGLNCGTCAGWGFWR